MSEKDSPMTRPAWTAGKWWLTSGMRTVRARHPRAGDRGDPQRERDIAKLVWAPGTYESETIVNARLIAAAPALASALAELEEVTSATENMLLGMRLDPAIPSHAKEAIEARFDTVDAALSRARQALEAAGVGK